MGGRGWRYLVMGLLLLVNVVHAEDTLDEVVVSGEQPGPGLWQVTNGGNTLWLLGTHSPLPKKMQWRAQQVEAVIARSQSVIAPPDVTAGIGFFSGLRLLPAMLRARSIPDDGTLKDVLPADLYARWKVLAARYSAPDKIDRWRPALAAFILYSRALDAAQLNNRDVVWPVVEKAAKRNHVEIRRSAVALQIKDPKGLINDYAKSDFTAEIGCFEGLVARMEHDMPLLQTQANAWATGDIAPLRKLSTDSPEQRCVDVLLGTPRLASMLDDAKRKFRLELLLAMEGALQRNSGTLAVVTISELMAGDGILSQLRQRGYQVIEPQ
ncbi:MAG: TraB/GumN family protein [Pseudomonadota bacterium]